MWATPCAAKMFAGENDYRRKQLPVKTMPGERQWQAKHQVVIMSRNKKISLEK